MKLGGQKRFLAFTAFLNMSIYCISLLIGIKTANILSLTDFYSKSKHSKLIPGNKHKAGMGCSPGCPLTVRAESTEIL